VIVFWSKHPAGLLAHLDELTRSGFHFYFQYTLNDYEAEGCEPELPPLADRIDLFRRLADRLGPDRVVWRLDPLLLTDRCGVPELLDKAARLAMRLAPYTRKLVFSFADIERYPGVRRNLARAGIAAREFVPAEMEEFARELVAINRGSGLALATCAEQVDLSSHGIVHNRCVDGELMARLWPEDAALMSFLGSSRARKDQGQRKACRCIASKDIGRYGTAILNDPCREFEPQHRHVDLLVMESTYGDRLHEPVQGLPDQLRRILLETHGRGGTLLIPSFAFGRTQELLYALHSLYAGGEVPRLPIYVDSPLATRMTKVYAEHPEVYDPQTHRAFLRQGKNPFDFKQVNFVTAVEDSMALMREDNPHIVIASSGMCEAGRILHHLRYKIHNPKNTIHIVGYMAQHTLGRRILELGEAYAADGRRGQAPIVRFLNKTYPLRARVVRLGGFSAHGDRDEMVRFLNNSGLDIQRIALVHGEEDQSLALAEHLRGLGFKVDVPETGQTLSV
jgi:Cft2 family RNA processing exonuclease